MFVLGSAVFLDSPFLDSPSGTSTEGERARIQAHLERVERELLSRDVSDLSPARRAARARHISTLRDYRLRGVFPHNHDFSDRRMPYFIDRHGTRCAMAHLIERSGGSDLVRRVAATNNNARVRELAGDPELLAWLEEEGLTVEEAARIQPEYDEQVPPVDDPRIVTNIRPAYIAGTVGASGLGVLAIALNRNNGFVPDMTGHGRGEFAVAVGLLGLGLGFPVLASSDGAVRGLGALNTGVGLMSLLTGVMRLRSAEQPPETPAQVRLVAAPLIGSGPRGASGAALCLRF
jgi:hypothetical protein